MTTAGQPLAKWKERRGGGKEGEKEEEEGKRREKAPVTNIRNEGGDIIPYRNKRDGKG